MNTVLVILGCWTLGWIGARRFVHWRGPREGTQRSAQDEHLRQFREPAGEDDDE